DSSSSWLPESVLGGPIHSGLSACVSTNRPQGSPRTRAIRRRLRNMPKKGAAAPSALELDRVSRSACSRRLFSLLGQDLSVSTQSLKDPKCDIFGPLTPICSGPDARRTSVLAWARADQLASAGQQRAATSIERFAESDPTWVSVVDVKIGFEEFFGLGTVRGISAEICPVDLTRRTWRTFAHSRAKVAAVAHH